MQARPPLIKLLLATETVACGVDTPTKTGKINVIVCLPIFIMHCVFAVIFEDVTKPDAGQRRLLMGV